MKEFKELWGNEKHFVHNTKCSVKILSVNPNQILSLQYHKKRKEIWYFLTDDYIQLGLKKRMIKKGKIVIIKKIFS